MEKNMEMKRRLGLCDVVDDKIWRCTKIRGTR